MPNFRACWHPLFETYKYPALEPAQVQPLPCLVPVRSLQRLRLTLVFELSRASIDAQGVQSSANKAQLQEIERSKECADISNTRLRTNGAEKRTPSTSAKSTVWLSAKTQRPDKSTARQLNQLQIKPAAKLLSGLPGETGIAPSAHRHSL